MNNNLTAQQSITETAASAAAISETTSKDSPPDKPVTMIKRIGSTTYQVSVHFSKTSTETISDKISRLIKNEADSGKAAV